MINCPKGDPSNINNNKKTMSDIEIEQLFLPTKELNISEVWILNYLKKLVEHVYRLVEKRKMDNNYIDQKMLDISTREILSNWEIFYMNPCLYLSLVTIEWLKKSGLKDIKLITRELLCNERKVLHFSIEFVFNWNIYHTDHSIKNLVYVGKWELSEIYLPRYKKLLNKIYLDAEKIWIDDNIKTLIEKWLINLQFVELDYLVKFKDTLKKSNTDARRINRSTNEVQDPQKPRIITNSNSI